MCFWFLINKEQVSIYNNAMCFLKKHFKTHKKVRKPAAQVQDFSATQWGESCLHPSICQPSSSKGNSAS